MRVDISRNGKVIASAQCEIEHHVVLCGGGWLPGVQFTRESLSLTVPDMTNDDVQFMLESIHCSINEGTERAGKFPHYCELEESLPVEWALVAETAEEVAELNLVLGVIAEEGGLL